MIGLTLRISSSRVRPGKNRITRRSAPTRERTAPFNGIFRPPPGIAALPRTTHDVSRQTWTERIGTARLVCGKTALDAYGYGTYQLCSISACD